MTQSEARAAGPLTHEELAALEGMLLRLHHDVEGPEVGVLVTYGQRGYGSARFEVTCSNRKRTAYVTGKGHTLTDALTAVELKAVTVGVYRECE